LLCSRDFWMSPACKSLPEVAREFITAIRERRERAGYDVVVTFFDNVAEFELHMPEDSLARVFVET